eukprot:TRINITY_DN12693_c0_g1_i3.p2 TRINITY_DN12693_c0_g1~~TRINITY_DN12693_c0_g1_i3.p2  ORF type:complete len:205 (-),score=35.56 TRINITY_DN12693_c0_g1_i3:371-985(-)
MSIYTYNGSAIIAMAGDECVAIGSDLRFGVNMQTLATDFQKLHKIHDKLFLGLSGLGTDAQTVYQTLRMKQNMYKLREERDMAPKIFNEVVSKTLYEKRFGPYFISPVIAGLDDDNQPFLSGMDVIGATSTSKDFMAEGTNTESLLGMCESVWRPGMNPDELFETLAQCLLSGVNRDALAGWGAIIYVITPQKVNVKTLRGRMD